MDLEAMDLAAAAMVVVVVDPATLRLDWDGLAGLGWGREEEEEEDEEEAGSPTAAAAAAADLSPPLPPLDRLVLLAGSCDAAVFGTGGGRHPVPGEEGAALALEAGGLAGLLGLAGWGGTGTGTGTGTGIGDGDGGRPREDEREDEDEDEEEARLLVATLLSLNLVESALRDLVGGGTGRAGRGPLLRDLIERLGEEEEEEEEEEGGGSRRRAGGRAVLAGILGTLLLPDGLNLRNLVWHGFVAAMPRRWMALCAVLVLNLRHLAGREGAASPPPSPHPPPLPSRGTVPLDRVLQLGRSGSTAGGMLPLGRRLLRGGEEGEGLDSLERSLTCPPHPVVPASHHALLKVALRDLARTGRPACFAAVASALLEHSLRVHWCAANGRPEDREAGLGYGRYYVTLDGHGQRDRHATLLAPRLPGEGGGEGENRLVRRLGGPAVAYLADLFTSPLGPNLRSAVAHGLWDGRLLRELERQAGARIGGSAEMGRTDDHAEDRGAGGAGDGMVAVTHALLAAFRLLAVSLGEGNDGAGAGAAASPAALGPPFAALRPTFSYAAQATRDLATVLREMGAATRLAAEGEDHLAQLPLPLPPHRQHPEALGALTGAKIGPDDLRAIADRVFPAHSGGWDRADVYRDHDFCVHLSGTRAACALMGDVAVALSDFAHTLQEAMKVRRGESKGCSSRRRKQASRICSVAAVALKLYSVAAYVALVQIERQVTGTTEGSLPAVTDEMLKTAVRRSSACVSTFSKLLHLNTDRSLRTAAEYASGKAVKMVVGALASDSKYDR